MKDAVRKLGGRVKGVLVKVKQILDPPLPLNERILLELVDRIERDAERPGGNYATAYVIWLRVDPDGEEFASAIQYFAEDASKRLESELEKGKIPAPTVRRVHGGDRRFHFEIRYVDAGQIDDVVPDAEARRELKRQEFGMEVMRTRFTIRVKVDGRLMPGFGVVVGNTALPPDVQTPCVLEGVPGDKLQIMVQKEGGFVGQTTVELPRPADADGGVVTIEVHSPRPPAGEVVVLALPDVTLSLGRLSPKCFEPITGLAIGEPFTIVASHNKLDRLSHTFTPKDSRRTYVALGMRPSSTLPGATVVFTSNQPSLLRAYPQPGVTLIRRAIAKPGERDVEGIPDGTITHALKTNANLTMNLGGMDQILLPDVGEMRWLPRSIWLWVVNMEGSGTLVDTDAAPGSQAGLQVVVAAIMFADKPTEARISLVSDDGTTLIEPTGKVQYRLLRPDVPLHVQAKLKKGPVTIFSLRQRSLQLGAAPVKVVGRTPKGVEREFLLGQNGSSLLLSPDLEACVSVGQVRQPGSEFLAELVLGTGGTVHLYPSDCTACDAAPTGEGNFTLKRGASFFEGENEFKII